MSLNIEDQVDANLDDGDHYQHPTTQSPPDVSESSLDSGLGSGTSSLALEDDVDEPYRMNRPSRGHLIVICNTKFDPELKLLPRQGTDTDIEEIRAVFGVILGFKVQVRKELKASEMMQCMAIAADNDHSDCNCFAAIILTHGADGGMLYGTDDKIALQKLMEPIENCDALVGKPKMIFVQACRGDKKDRGKMVADAAGSVDLSCTVNIPIKADFLYAFSSAEGYVSFQNPTRGSWFIEELCKEIRKSWDKADMITILTRVCRVLAYQRKSKTPSNRLTHDLKQISSITMTLTKVLKFNCS